MNLHPYSMRDMPFKVGDRVRCVYPEDNNFLQKDAIYIVIGFEEIDTNECYVRVRGCEPSYFPNRFIKALTPKGNQVP